MLAIRKASLAAVTIALTLALCGVAEAVPMNLAPGGTSTADSQGCGSVFQDGNDGNRDGNFGNGSVWHTTDFIGTHYDEVDLGSDYYLDRIQLFPRTGAGPHWTSFRIEVRDSSNAVVFNQSFLPAASANANWGTTAVRNVVGQTVRIETNGTPMNTSHAEFEVWGQTRPIRANLALTGAVTGTQGGWGATTADAIDGDIDSHFYHPRESGAPRFLLGRGLQHDHRPQPVALKLPVPVAPAHEALSVCHPQLPKAPRAHKPGRLSHVLWTPKRASAPCTGHGRHPLRRTPAMAAGLTDHIWSIQEWIKFPARLHPPRQSSQPMTRRECSDPRDRGP